MSNIKRIIILTNTLKNGGAEKQSIMLANALQLEYPTYLIIYYGNKYDAKLKSLAEDYNLNIIWLKGSHFNKIYFLYKFFKKEKDTVIFSYLATTNILNAFIGKLTGIKWRIGGIRNAKLSKKKFYIQRFLHNNYLTYSIFNNFRGKEELCEKGFNKEKSCVIHNSYKIKRSIKNKEKDNYFFNIITIGRFVKQKDFFTSIDTFKLLCEKIKIVGGKKKIKYIIIGYGKLENQIKLYIKEKKINEGIEIIINPPNATDYLSNAHVYLSTSLYEGLSNSIMEAMEYSLPIVATNVGDNDKLIINNKNGFLTEIHESKELSNKLFELYFDENKRNDFGCQSYILLKERFSDLTFKNNYLNLIKNL